MTAEELREKIKILAPEVYANVQQAEVDAVEYDELTNFPELKEIIINLLTHDFDTFLSGIGWVAPRPTTFRITLKNGQEFYLIYTNKSWIAQVEGKKYYLLNLPEEERCALAIARILCYGPKPGEETEEEDVSVDVEAGGGETETEVDVEEPAATSDLDPDA